MKFNWGTGIALFYGTFMVVLLYFVIQSTKQDNSLVSDDYYGDDLRYQQHYTKLTNAAALSQDLRIWENAAGQQLELQFPKDLGSITGEIHFFCPSDIKSDFKVDIQPDDAFRQAIPSGALKKGLWKIKVDWQAGGKAFFKEESIVF